MRFPVTQFPVLRQLLLPLLLAAPPGQAAATDSDTGLWATLTAGTTFSDRWSGSLALQSRSDNDIGTLERIVLRPSLSYRINERYTLTGGYDLHDIRAPGDRVEQRLWQQGSGRWQVGGFALTTRLRLEQRFIEDAGGTAAVRLRLLQRVSRNLGRSRWYAAVSNEVFYSVNDLAGGPGKGFDQNRLYLGFGRNWPSTQAEFGYQMQYIDRPAVDLMIHQLMLNLRF